MKDVRVAVGGTDCFDVFRTGDVFVAEVVKGAVAAFLRRGTNNRFRPP